MSIPSFDGALDGVQRALVDSTTLIAFHSPLERVHPLAKYLLGRVAADRDPLTALYSTAIAAEVLVRPILIGDDHLTFMHAWLVTHPHLVLLPVDLSVAMQAATLRAVTNIQLPDALVIASGLLAGCEAIVSNDEAWARKLSPLFRQFRWVYLADHL